MDKFEQTECSPLIDNGILRCGITIVRPISNQIFPFEPLSTKSDQANAKVECRKSNRNVVSNSVDIIFLPEKSDGNRIVRTVKEIKNRIKI